MVLRPILMAPSRAELKICYVTDARVLDFSDGCGRKAMVPG